VPESIPLGSDITSNCELVPEREFLQLASDTEPKTELTPEYLLISLSNKSETTLNLELIPLANPQVSMPFGSVTASKIELALIMEDGSDIGGMKLDEPEEIADEGHEIGPKKVDELRPSRKELGSDIAGR
jgi:hypothetical protein